jgi:hypothetical protein
MEIETIIKNKWNGRIDEIMDRRTWSETEAARKKAEYDSDDTD